MNDVEAEYDIAQQKENFCGTSAQSSTGPVADFELRDINEIGMQTENLHQWRDADLR